MPASGPKRVKNVRITRNFVIGSEAWELDDSTRPADTPPDHTKGWKVYVKNVDNGPNLTAWLKKVQFKIYHTYNSPVRVIEEPPFEIQETGWGGFLVDIKLFFVPEASAKPEMRSHFLQLENYGEDEVQARQKRENMVRSEAMEIIEFNEPPEGLYAILTGEEQWMRKKEVRGKGKGAKGKARATEVNTEGTVELPENGGIGNSNPFSRETERAQIEMLRKKIEMVELERKAEDEKMKEVLKRLDETRQGRGNMDGLGTAALNDGGDDVMAEA